jgi:hypothetical protein
VFPVMYELGFYIPEDELGAAVMVHIFSPGLLARSQFASASSCDRPARSKFFVVFLASRTNAESVPKFHVAVQASHAALPMVTSKCSP